MTTEIVEFSLEPDDVVALDRLAEIYTDGNRDALLREAIRIMASQERAERLRLLQERIHAGIGTPRSGGVARLGGFGGASGKPRSEQGAPRPGSPLRRGPTSAWPARAFRERGVPSSLSGRGRPSRRGKSDDGAATVTSWSRPC